MTPDEYRAMYERTYGVSADEGNSYLNCAAMPSDEDVEDYGKYYDYSGAIQYMSDDYFYDSPFSVDPETLPGQDCIFFDDCDDLPNSELPTPEDFVSGVPLLPIDSDKILTALSSANDVTVTFKGHSEIDVNEVDLSKCIHALLSLGISPPKDATFEAHDTEHCPWCRNAPKTNRYRFFMLRGARVHGIPDGIDLKPDKILKPIFSPDRKYCEYFHFLAPSDRPATPGSLTPGSGTLAVVPPYRYKINGRRQYTNVLMSSGFKPKLAYIFFRDCYSRASDCDPFDPYSHASQDSSCSAPPPVPQDT